MTRKEIEELREKLRQADSICRSLDNLSDFLIEINADHSNLGAINLNWYISDSGTRNRDIAFAPTRDEDLDAAIKSHFVQFLCQTRASLETVLKKL